MKRHIPGLHSQQTKITTVSSKGCSWSVSMELPTVGIRRNHSSRSVLLCSSLNPLQRRSFSGRLYCTERALWKLNWFLRDFGYDQELLGRDQVDEKALLNLRGVVRTSHVTLNGRSFQNLEAFAPAAEWEELSCARPARARQENADDL